MLHGSTVNFYSKHFLAELFQFYEALLTVYNMDKY